MAAKEFTPVNTTERLAKLRALFEQDKYKLNAYVIPSEDAHQSEYTAPCDQRRAFISGFTGSAGLAIVSKQKALLFTDGRYFLQASLQLDSNWTLMKQGLPDVPTWQEYLVQNFTNGSRIGIDPTLITFPDARSLSESLEKVGSTLVSTDENLVDSVWGKDKPTPAANPVTMLALRYSGRSHADKIASLRVELAKLKVYGFVITALDEIAWFFNLRGSDVPYNPVFHAYSLVTKNDITLYTNESRITNEAKFHLGTDVKLSPYSAIFEDLRNLKTKLKEEKQAR
ncbi:11095_t:CDS:2 [Ambispora leptoticha]|uniref:11095_t:CDS:1 n=1 Tax=Ambispora leptoticha TaxID=144679 RepID=A0A9N9GYE1_9GLOM|nr:11095_t:CDS:2 [Ambispora leptoticha]